jgi:transformation/transcription domain-associated protein
MAALSSHLRPAPYPYGLLALRLLGKLGGKNRRFLRDTMVLPRYDTPAIPAELFVDCAWTMGEEKDVNSSHISKFSIPVPITSALKVLQSAAQIDLESHDTGEIKSPCPDDEFDVPLKHLERGNTELLFTERSDHVDLGAYCYDVVAETLREQASDALNLLCASLASILDVGGLPSDITKVLNKEELMESTPSPERRKVSLGSSERTECFKYIIQGLLFGLSVKDISDDAALCLQGLFHYLFAAISNFSQYVVRIDANGTRTLEETETAVLLELSANKTDSVHDQEQSTSQPDLGLSKPFGYFEVSGPFEAINPFVFCEALAEIVGHHSMLIQTKAADFFAETLKESVESLGILSSGFEIGAIGSSYMALYESFLESFSRLLVSRPWNTISGLHRTILVMTDVLGLEWSRKYELELVQIAFISVKNSPKEVSYAGVQAFRFFVDIFTALYGKPYVSDSDGFIPNMTAKSENKDVPGGSTSEDTLQGKINYLIPSDSVVSLIISELASTKEIVR